MKKFFLTVLAAGAITAASAQKSAVNAAITNQANGTLDKAKAEIDKAIEHKKTKDDAKTWFVRGTVYQDLINHPIYGKLATEETPKIVIASFKKTIELDGENGEYGKQVPERMQQLYGQVLNEAVEHHNKQEWEQAIEGYKFASEISPKDTTAVLYAAYAAQANKDYPQAIKFYDKVLDLGHRTENIYSAKIQLMQATNASEEEIMAALAEGLKHSPNSVYLMQEELRYYLKNGKGAEAKAKLEKAIKADPNNASLYAVLGNIQEQNKDLDAAVTSYKKAIELDPNNFDSYYNLGVIEYNRGGEFGNKAAKMDYKTYQKQGKALEAQAKKHYETALPYFEKAHKIQPEDRNTIQNLMRIYSRLNRTAEANSMQKLLDK